MSELKREVRTSLEIGFPEAGPPERLLKYRGRVMRSVAATATLPYEDSQFEVVLLDGASVTRPIVKEVHRVLRPNGELRFVVPERSAKQDGMTLPEIYSVVRDGFNIVELHRSAWWFFCSRGRTLTICAKKKTWKSLNNTYRPYV